MIPRAAIFDFDGTLVHSNHIKRDGFVQAAISVGVSLDLVEDILAEPAVGSRFEIMKEVAKRAVADSSVPSIVSQLADRLVERYSEYCRAEICNCPEIPGASEALEDFFSLGIPIFVNSATPTSHLECLVQCRGWKEMFTGVYGKPESKEQNIYRVLNDLALSPHEVIMVGDGPDDAAAAVHVSCCFVHVAYDRKPENNVVPNLVITDLSGFVSKVSNI
jgi:phosphoglycolate phosphatase